MFLKSNYLRVLKLGRAINNGEGKKGKIVHAMPPTERKAFCGAVPGLNSAGWRETESSISCPKCKSHIERSQKARDVTPISRLNSRMIEPDHVSGVVHGMRTDRFVYGCRRQALCGAMPGSASAGWYSPEGQKITCPKCIKRMARNGSYDYEL